MTVQGLDEVERFVQVGKLAPIGAAPLRAEVAHGQQDLIDELSDLEVPRLDLFINLDKSGYTDSFLFFL